MKRTLLSKIMLLLCALAAGSGSMWADDQTITLTYSSFGLETSYKEKTATVSGFGFTVDQGYKGSGNVIQMNSTKGKGILYNTTAIPGLKSIKVNVSSGNKTYTITTGTSEKPTANSQTGTTGGTYNASSGDTFFQLKVSGISYFSSIEITYTPSAGSSDPSIIASNVNISSNATSGSIEYTLNNATGNVEAEVTSGDWLTLDTITSSRVPFTCSANPGTTSRTAEVTLSFTGAEDKVVTITQAAPPEVDSGNCGTKDHESEVTWMLLGTSPNYTLIISGSGAMADFGYNAQPWYSYRTSIKTVVINSGITRIGNNSFYNCSSLTSATIPSSGLTSIGNSAFRSCSSLASINIPDDLTSIGDYAFEGCKITSINIPSGVTSIGFQALFNCTSLSNITVDSGNNYYSSENGVLFNKDKTRIIQYAIAKSGDTYTLPATVTYIYDHAFRNCKNITSFDVPDGVTKIGAYAFSGCSNLASVTIANSVTTIYDNAFSWCTNLTSVSLPNSLQSISYATFKNCTNLESITIPSSVTYIDQDAFTGCSKLGTVSLNSNPRIYTTAFPSGATVTMNLSAKEGAEGEYWTTFYNQNYNFEISDAVGQNTQIFKAALSGTKLTLKELGDDPEEDKIITKDKAVIMKSNASPMVFTLTTTDSGNDYDTDNSLFGVSSASGQTATGTQYVLNKGTKGVGFYKMTSGKVIGVGKAYLTYAGGSLAPAYFHFFEDVDGVEELQPFTVNREPLTEESYDLMGRLAKPNSKGIRITKGHIMYVK